jgi:ribonuclease Z
MAMEITFLGTSSMVPTKERGQSGILLDCGKEKILFDCGESMQRQLRIAGIAPPKITRVFISHDHGDHIFGLPGLLENIAKNSAEKKIEIYGTVDFGKKLKQIVKTFEIGHKIDINFTAIEKNGVFLDTGDLQFGAHFLNHGVPCLGYYVREKDNICIDKVKMKKLKLPSGPIIAKLKSKKDVTFEGKKIKWKNVTFVKEGKKVSVVLDTAICSAAVSVAKDSDILICESTFLKEMKIRAKKYKHLTSEDAGEIAKKGKCKKLVLTHFSQRYEKEEISTMLKEAKKVFKKDVVAANDFMKIKV